MKRKRLFAWLLLAAAASGYAQVAENFSFHVRPEVDLPIGGKSALFYEDAAYRVGGNAAIYGQYLFPKAPFLYAEGGATVGLHPTQAADALTLASAGVGFGCDIRVLDRVSLQLGAQGGYSFGFFGAYDPAGNPYLGGSLAAAWDLSPGFALSAGGAYRYHVGWDPAAGAFTDLYQGVGVWAGAILRLQPDSGRRKLRIADLRTEPLFPVFFGYYEHNPFGTMTVSNLENSAITNVDVYFYVGEYMEQPMLTASFPSIGRRDSVEVPLKALFTSRLMNLTERAKVAAEIKVSYTYLGERVSYSQPVTVTVLDRNSMTWDDDRKAASFVTPRDPTVMIFSKNTAGIIRDLGANPLNLNFRIAMGIFEAMRLYGLNYVIDPLSSFVEASKDELFLDYLQFPSQSLIYRAGDCDDLSILYAALLESVGIETAFITVPGHIFMAFSLGLTELEARQAFTSAGDFIYADGKAWVPVEVTIVQDGFNKAFKTGIKQWKEAVSKGVGAFYPIHEAWRTYAPVGYTGNTLSLLFPQSDLVVQSYKASLDAFVAQEIQPKIDGYESIIRRGGDRASTRNAYGIMYARYGRFDDAERQFKAALALDRRSVNAMINLGNLFYLRERMDDALQWYRGAASVEPDNPLAVAGLARVQYEREEYLEAQSQYARLSALAPDVAARYAYIGSASTTIMRASSALDKGETLWDGGEE